MAEQIVAGRNALSKADDPPASDINLVLESIDFSSWDALRAAIEPILIGVTQSGLGAAFDQIGFEPTTEITDQTNAKAVEWARARAAELVGMSYDDKGNLVDNPDPEMAITESTRGMLRGAVADAITDGSSVATLTEQLEDEFAFSGTRAENIAQYEIAQADVQGNLIAYKESGVVAGKEWLLGSEHDDVDECDEAADLGVVDLDDDFNGIGDPPAHVGCVCDIAVTLIDGEEE